MREKTKFSLTSFLVLGLLLVLVICSSLLLGCQSKSAVKYQQVNLNAKLANATDSRFAGFELDGVVYDTFFDRASGVYYAVFRDTYTDSLAVTVLYNINGLPLCVDNINEDEGMMNDALESIESNVRRYEELENNG